MACLGLWGYKEQEIYVGSSGLFGLAVDVKSKLLIHPRYVKSLQVHVCILGSFGLAVELGFLYLVSHVALLAWQ